MRVLIAGGGIGGLAAAVALARRGIEAEVWERSAEYRAIGAGITISVNAMAALAEIGLAEAVLAAGVRLGDGDLRDPRGRRLSVMPLEAMERAVGIPSVGIHRGALQDVLLDAVGRARVHTGSPVGGFTDHGDRVTMHLERGGEAVGDVVVGADGLRSAVRAQILDDGPPRYSGYTCWRGLADVDPTALGLRCFFEAWGRGERFGGIPVSDDCFFWYVAADAPAGGVDAPGAALAALTERFCGWAEPVPTLLRSTRADRVIRNDICDRPPAARWGEGRVTLLGDAAHPMTPNMGQGACQALEDAVVLADRLSRAAAADGASPVSGLRAYERARRRRARFFVDASWRVGRFAQAAGPVTARARDALLRWTPDALVRAACVAAGRPPSLIS